MQILIADDHPIVVEAITQNIKIILPSAKIYTTNFAKPIIDLIVTNNINFLILDVQLTDGNSLYILNELKEKSINIHIMVFTTIQINNSYIKYNNGQVWGFVNKNINNIDLRKVVANFITQKEIYTLNIEELIMPSKDLPNQNKLTNKDTLSKNEKLVFELLSNDMSIKEIASITNKNINTVATYKKRIFHKLNIKSAMEFFDLIKKNKL